MTTQNEKLAALLKRKGKTGVTAMEIIAAIGSVSPNRRLFELKQKGWTITHTKAVHMNYGRYVGVPPKKAAPEPEHVPAKPPWPEHNFKAGG